MHFKQIQELQDFSCTLIFWKDVTYLQRSLSPAEWSLLQFQQIQELQDFSCNIILFPGNDTVYPQRKPQEIHKFREPQGISCIFEESISILPQKPEEMRWSFHKKPGYYICTTPQRVPVQISSKSLYSPESPYAIPRQIFAQLLTLLFFPSEVAVMHSLPNIHASMWHIMLACICILSFCLCCGLSQKSLHVECPHKQKNTPYWSCSPQRSMPRGWWLFQL